MSSRPGERGRRLDGDDGKRGRGNECVCVCGWVDSDGRPTTLCCWCWEGKGASDGEEGDGQGETGGRTDPDGEGPQTQPIERGTHMPRRGSLLGRASAPCLSPAALLPPSLSALSPPALPSSDGRQRTDKEVSFLSPAGWLHAGTPHQSANHRVPSGRSTNSTASGLTCRPLALPSPLPRPCLAPPVVVFRRPRQGLPALPVAQGPSLFVPGTPLIVPRSIADPLAPSCSSLRSPAPPQARCPGPSPDSPRCARCTKAGPDTACVYVDHRRGRKVGTRSVPSPSPLPPSHARALTSIAAPVLSTRPP